MYALFIFLALLIFILLILLSQFKVKLAFRYSLNYNYIIYRIYFHGFKIYNGSKDMREKGKPKQISKKKRNFNFNLRNIKVIAKSANINTLQSEFIIGLGEANYTAYAAGVIYTLMGTLESVLMQHVKINKGNTEVKCVFNDFALRIKIDCIVTARGANIIHGILKILHNNRKKTEGKSNERTSNTRPYEYRYAEY